MNQIGIDDSTPTIVNCNNDIIPNGNSQSEQISIAKKMLPTKNGRLMFISLTLHSLGIIFGDM
jgi:hypothetical protein